MEREVGRKTNCMYLVFAESRISCGLSSDHCLRRSLFAPSKRRSYYVTDHKEPQLRTPPYPIRSAPKEDGGIFGR